MRSNWLDILEGREAVWSKKFKVETISVPALNRLRKNVETEKSHGIDCPKELKVYRIAHLAMYYTEDYNLFSNQKCMRTKLFERNKRPNGLPEINTFIPVAFSDQFISPLLPLNLIDPTIRPVNSIVRVLMRTLYSKYPVLWEDHYQLPEKYEFKINPNTQNYLRRTYVFYNFDIGYLEFNSYYRKYIKDVLISKTYFQIMYKIN